VAGGVISERFPAHAGMQASLLAVFVFASLCDGRFWNGDLRHAALTILKSESSVLFILLFILSGCVQE